MMHTKEPWAIEPCTHLIWGPAPTDDTRTWGNSICEPKASYHCYPSGISPDEAGANAARIVECVNACAGLNPAAIPDVVEALRKLVDEHIERGPFDVPLGQSEQSGAINRAVAALAALQVQS